VLIAEESSGSLSAPRSPRRIKVGLSPVAKAYGKLDSALADELGLN